MNRYRKMTGVLPVVVDAIQLTPENTPLFTGRYTTALRVLSMRNVEEWVLTALPGDVVILHDQWKGGIRWAELCKSAGKVIRIELNDYLVNQVGVPNEEAYVVKPELFRLSYEPVSTPDPQQKSAHQGEAWELQQNRIWDELENRLRKVEPQPFLFERLQAAGQYYYAQGVDVKSLVFVAYRPGQAVKLAVFVDTRTGDICQYEPHLVNANLYEEEVDVRRAVIEMLQGRLGYEKNQLQRLTAVAGKG